MTQRVAIYARYSSDMQSQASIEDQIRICTLRAEREGWHITLPYSDYAVSGASMHRAGLQMLMQDAAMGKFDVVLTEGLDRLSRDQEDIAGIYKRLSFAGVKIFSLSDGGEVSDIHIGLKGTMNALFLKDLAAKTHRGIRGRVEKGKSGGGRSYGYDVVRQFNAAGEPVRGDRNINPEQAAIITRIFEDYAAGLSPRRIATALNKNNTPAPTVHGWATSTINGARKQASGIINNELYIGRLIWNRHNYLKDPDTGKRTKRLNPRADWVITDVPELQIVDQALWDKVKARQKTQASNIQLDTKRRPKALLSFLLKCGCCGGGYSQINAVRYGCTNARSKGTCDNHISITKTKLENAVLGAMQSHLMHPELFEVFCKEYTAHMKQLSQQQNTHIEQANRKLAKLTKDKTNLIEAIKQGIPACEVKGDIIRIAAEREKVETYLSHMTLTPILLNPNMAQRYHSEVAALRKSLHQDDHTQEAADLLRSLIDKIVLTPNEAGKKLNLNVYGDLAGILSMATGQPQDLALMADFEGDNKQETSAKNPSLQYLLTTAIGLTL